MGTGACALIPAAGRGARFGEKRNKVLTPLLDRPLLAWTVDAFARCDVVDAIVLIGSDCDLYELSEIGERYGGGKVRGVVRGGEDRQASVAAGLAAADEAEYIAVHDAARPCVTPDLIEETLAAARHCGAATAAAPIADTLIREEAGGAVGENVPRDGVWAVQTPQAFRSHILREAHRSALARGFRGTDDAGLVRASGHPVQIVHAPASNLKVTVPADRAVAEAILRQREDIGSVSATRIGFGYDVHRLVEGRRLFLGGVEFPGVARGLLGHSDADVVLHAVCDALLGAAALGDIGKLFPNNDPAHRDRPSIEFLREVAAQIKDAGYLVANIDITVIAEAPKIGPHAAEMQTIIARALKIADKQVSIKATTNEGMGFVGREEGIAAHAVAMLSRRTP